MKRAGFTIVELLIVIVVIGILAAITLVTYAGAQDRARATAVVAGIHQVRQAFQLDFTDNNIAAWPPDTYFTGVSSPSLQSIIDKTSSAPAVQFARHLPAVPQVAGLDNLTWRYVNSGGTMPRDCSQPGVVRLGPTLVIEGIPTAVAREIDTAIDDGDANCGTVRYSASATSYQLGYTQDDL